MIEWEKIIYTKFNLQQLYDKRAVIFAIGNHDKLIKKCKQLLSI